ncbi:uncharacterized protein LOC123223225 [Mangifera indica]|uniref:uncharacterized protein LOC123223225 n=1 Tax=Mangifera indica TaxID=29780 RepID=UPI001CFB1EEE|nr:uncharacterized protein LOC123223225 [Mangifera indica]
MTRKKVNLAWIVSDSARKACLKKRKLGLMKKSGRQGAINVAISPGGPATSDEVPDPVRDRAQQEDDESRKERRKEIKKRLIYCQQVNAVHEAEAFPPPLPAENKQSPTAVGDMIMRNPIESALWDQWFMEGVNHSENEANLGLRAPDQTIFDTNFNYATNQMELAQGNFIPNYNNEHPDQMQLPYETNFNLNPSGGGHANETLLPSEFEFFIGSGDVGIPFDVTKP